MSREIVFDQVNFSYDNFPILKNVSFTIDEGEFIGIFGPNGGGKTTLLRLMMGMLAPKSGKITLFGLSPDTCRCLIGYVPQKLVFDKQFPITAFEVVLSGRLAFLPWYGRYRETDREEALLMLKKVGMTEYADVAFGHLSGGQAQRVLIARALASHPKVLLLDEPTSGVDIGAEADIHDILETIRATTTIIMVTHQLRSVIQQVKRVLCVQNTVVSLSSDQVCEHFAIGLYHPLLTDLER